MLFRSVDGETGEIEDKKFRYTDTENKDFWLKILTDKTFQKAVEKKYTVSHGKIMKEEDDVSEVLAAIEDEGDE